MSDMISRLHQSHFAIIPADVYENIDAPAKKGDRGGSTGLIVRVIDGEAIVTSVTPGTPAESAGVRPGWEIARSTERKSRRSFPPIEKEFAEQPEEGFLSCVRRADEHDGAIGDTVTRVFMDERDRRSRRTMMLRGADGQEGRLRQLPAVLPHASRRTRFGSGIGYFTFSFFFDPVTLMPAFGNAMQSFMDAPGIIIDVRGNPGRHRGDAAWGWPAGSSRRRTSTWERCGRASNTLKLVINPRARRLSRARSPSSSTASRARRPRSSRAACRVSRGSASSDRGRSGATLPSLAERLPNGDGFQYAFASYIIEKRRRARGRGGETGRRGPPDPRGAPRGTGSRDRSGG